MSFFSFPDLLHSIHPPTLRYIRYITQKSIKGFSLAALFTVAKRTATLQNLAYICSNCLDSVKVLKQWTVRSNSTFSKHLFLVFKARRKGTRMNSSKKLCLGSVVVLSIFLYGSSFIFLSETDIKKSIIWILKSCHLKIKWECSLLSTSNKSWIMMDISLKY